MITEIVTYGTLSLPYSLAVVGIVPGVVLIVFLGVFALYTALVLIKFKLNHPEVHNLGDAGYILFGPLGWLGREILSLGTILFAIFAVGGQLIAADAALGSLSENKLCLLWYTGIFAIPTLFLSLPRALNMSLSWLSVAATFSILIASIVAMAGAGLHPTPGRTYEVTKVSNFYLAFSSVANPVFAYADPRHVFRVQFWAAGVAGTCEEAADDDGECANVSGGGVYLCRRHVCLR